MPKNKDIVTIDLSALSAIEQDGDKFLMTSEAEDALLKLIELKKQVEFVEEKIKATLGDAMRALECVKIEGEGVKVVRRYYGERYEVSDPQLAVQIGVAKEVTFVKPDSKAIDQYLKDTEELPDGIKLRERTESVSIAGAKEKNHGGE